MKLIFCILSLIISLLASSAFCQKDKMVLVFKEWVYDVDGGMKMYCGLPHDDASHIYDHYRLPQSDSLVLTRKVSTRDSSYAIGYFSLKKTIDGYLCWHEDYVWTYFTKNNVFIKQEIFNNQFLVKEEELEAFKVILEKER